MCGLPLFHVNGTTVTGSFPFSIGAHVVILSARGYRDPTVMKNFYKIVEHYRAVTFSAVPTILSVLLDIPKGDADISSLRYLVCGAAPLSVELFKRFEAHSGMKDHRGLRPDRRDLCLLHEPFSRRTEDRVHRSETSLSGDEGLYYR